MGVSGDVSAVVLDQRQIAVILQFVSGIGDSAAGGSMNGCAHRRGDIDAVIALAITGGSEVGDYVAGTRPEEVGPIAGIVRLRARLGRRAIGRSLVDTRLIIGTRLGGRHGI